MRRFQAGNGSWDDGNTTPKSDFGGRWLVILFVVVLALLWLPTRLVQEANPEWRLISWALGIEVVSLTLLSVNLAFGSAWAWQVAFPVCFFLVAVPWSTVIEAPVIQSLTRLNSSVVVELMGVMGIPALQHGNLIEVSTGTVGVDEACSGIRSFQTSLMISLFLGEFYAMSWPRRLLLVPAGFALAMAFNVCRMSFLTVVAAKRGVAAIAQYHDPAGVAITVGCTLGLWGLGLIFRKKPQSASGKLSLTGGSEQPVSGSAAPSLKNGLLFSLSFSLLAWFLFVGVGVEWWYRWHEAKLPKRVAWSMSWPSTNPTFVKMPLPERTMQLLRYDEGSDGTWQEQDGTQWEVIFLRWLPGQIAVHLAKSHTPEVCLAAAGHSVQTNPGVDYVPVHGLRLPFRSYSIEDAGKSTFVFYCLWEDRAWEDAFQTTKLSYGNRLDPVLEGRRNVGQRSLEVVVRGFGSIEEARRGLAGQLEKLVKVNEGASITAPRP